MVRSKSQIFTIDELAALVHPRASRPKLFAMLEAYLDESGIHDGAAVCVVAGYYGGRRQWKELEKSWRACLQEFEVPLDEFHAKNLVRKTAFFLPWDRARCEALKLRLAEAIAAQPKIHAVSATILIDDFNSFAETTRKGFTGAFIKNGKMVGSGCANKPYFVPFMHCIRQVACSAPVGGKVHFFFGLGHHFAGYAGALFDELVNSQNRSNCKDRIGTVAFPQAKETPQLQAADFLAYLTYLHADAAHREGTLGKADPNQLLALCIDNRGCQEDCQFINREYLQTVLNESRSISGNWDEI